MKKIGIDARLINQTGVGCYLRNLIHYLPEEKGFIFYLYLLKRDFQSIKINQKNFIKREADFQWHSFSEQLGFFKTILSDNLDLMHFTYFSHPILYKKKFISTIHDLTYLLYPTGRASTRNFLLYQIKYFFFKTVLKNQVKNSHLIITPTKTVKEEIVKYYGNDVAPKIIPLYEGVNYELKETKENLSLAGKYKTPFFIYVGNFYPHKNLERLIKAFQLVKNSHRLILLGPDDFFAKRISNFIYQLNLQQRIIIFKNPKLNDLVFFYKKAQALIHPSLSEGFGLPLVEAAYFNCPIIASDIAVFNEILDNQYLKFNPNSETDIAEKINSFIDKKPIYKYQSLLKKFSFKKMALKTFEIYQKI